MPVPKEKLEPVAAVPRAPEGAEARLAGAAEELVARDSFGEVLALVTGNVVALVKVTTVVGDTVVRNLRLAGRRDIVALGRQLARTEDKLEQVLQEVEALQDQLRRSPPKP